MIIISDTGPLRYLIEVNAIHTLPALYKTIVTTPQVIAELQFNHFPDKVRTWALNPPQWLRIESPSQVAFLDVLSEGEASAISLARQRSADIVLIDERLGSRIAQSVGLKTAGTLAVLMDAGEQKLIDFHQTINILITQTKFRCTKELIDQVVIEFEKRVQN